MEAILRNGASRFSKGDALSHFERKLENGIWIVSTRPEHASPLEALQVTVFPTLADTQRFKAPHYLKHIEMFGDGQFVALDGSRVVGMTTSIRMHFDFNHGHHTFDEVFQGGWLTSHDDDGDWLYGADIGTHPEYRGKGLARALYAARQHTVTKLGLKGQVTVGMLSGYGAVKDACSIEDYFQDLKLGRRFDPTISAQRKIGFEIRDLVRDYLDDPVCSNCGVLLTLDAKNVVALQ